MSDYSMFIADICYLVIILARIESFSSLIIIASRLKFLLHVCLLSRFTPNETKAVYSISPPLLTTARQAYHEISTGNTIAKSIQRTGGKNILSVSILKTNTLKFSLGYYNQPANQPAN